MLILIGNPVQLTIRVTELTWVSLSEWWNKNGISKKWGAIRIYLVCQNTILRNIIHILELLQILHSLNLFIYLFNDLLVQKPQRTTKALRETNEKRAMHPLRLINCCFCHLLWHTEIKPVTNLPEFRIEIIQSKDFDQNIWQKFGDWLRLTIFSDNIWT